MPWTADPAVLRLAAFLCVLCLLLILERAWPRRRDAPRRRLRWRSNFGLAAIGAGLLLLLPVAALGSAYWAERAGIGLFHQLALPGWLEVALAWLLLDLAIYAQHRAFHGVPWLWPLHRVHHSDIMFDVSLGLRFHPAELLLSMQWKIAVIVALGAPPLAVLLLEIALNAFALWSHANLRYPAALERVLRRALVTPELHRVHHSVHRAETDSNYGSSLILWDHLFGSFRAHPRDGHERMRIGLGELRAEREQRLMSLLAQPLRK